PLPRPGPERRPGRARRPQPGPDARLALRRLPVPVDPRRAAGRPAARRPGPDGPALRHLGRPDPAVAVPVQQGEEHLQVGLAASRPETRAPAIAGALSRSASPR